MVFQHKIWVAHCKRQSSVYKPSGQLATMSCCSAVIQPTELCTSDEQMGTGPACWNLSNLANANLQIKARRGACINGQTFWWPLCALSSLARWAQAAAMWACSRRMTGSTSCPSTSRSRPSCSRDSPLPEHQADAGVKTSHLAQQDSTVCGLQTRD